MSYREDAEAILRLVIAKVPDLARHAVKVSKRTSEKLLMNGAAELAEQALAFNTLTPDERVTLTLYAMNHEDDTRHRTFRLRLSPKEWTELEYQMVEHGFKDMSQYARWKLFNTVG